MPEGSEAEIDRTECTIMECSGAAEFGYWTPDLGDFSRAREPEHDLLDDGDLSPYVCQRCRDRMASQSRWDSDRFVRPEEKLVADGGEVEAETSGDRPTPPVPPTDEIVHPEAEHASNVVESDAVDTCDCGGTLYDETITTGRVIIAMWDATDFDPDRYSLSEEYDETERRVRCDRCNAGWSY